MRFTLTALFTCVWCLSIGQTTALNDFEKAYQAAINSYNEKNYVTARNDFEDAAHHAEKMFGRNSDQFRNANWYLVWTYQMLGESEKTYSAYGKVLAVTNPPLNEEGIGYFVGLTEYTADYFRQKDLGKWAFPMYKRAMRLRRDNNLMTNDYALDLVQILSYSYDLRQYDSIHYYYDQLFTVLKPGDKDFPDQLTTWIDYSIKTKAYDVYDRIERKCDEFLKAKEAKNERDQWYAEMWLQYAYLLKGRGQYERAINCVRESRKVIEPHAAEVPTYYLKILRAGIETYNAAKKSDQPGVAWNRDFEKANDALVNNAEKQQAYTENLAFIAMFYFYRNDFLEAERVVEKALPAVEKFYGKNSQDYLMMMASYKGMLERNGHQHKLKDIEYTQAEKDAYLKMIDTEGVEADMEKLNRYLPAGDYLKAIQIFERRGNVMSEYFAELKDFDTYTKSLQGIAHCYQMIGNFVKAEELFLKAEQVALEKMGPDHLSTPLIVDKVGAFYTATGAWPEAEDRFYKAMKMATASRDKGGDVRQSDDNYYAIATHLGDLYTKWRYFDTAEEIYLDVLNYQRKNHPEESEQVIYAKLDLGNLYRAMEIYADAERLLLECEVFFRKTYGENTHAYINMIGGLAANYFQRGNYAKAEPLYLKCRDYYLKYMGSKSPRYIDIITDLGILYFHQGNYEKANEHYQLLNQIALYQADNFFPSLSEKEKTAFYSEMQQSFNSYNAFAARYSKQNPAEVNEMFDLQLLTKGMLFKATNKMRQTVLASQDDSLRILYDGWIGTKNRLAAVYRMSDGEKKAAGIDEKLLEQHANALEKNLSRRSELFGKIISNRPTWSDIQRQLKPGEAAVEMVRIREALPAYSFSYMGKGIQYDTLGKDGYLRVVVVHSDRTPAWRAGVREQDIFVEINGVSTRNKSLEQIGKMLDVTSVQVKAKRKDGSEYRVTLQVDSVFTRHYVRKHIYAALILTAESKSHAELVVLRNGDDLESRYIRYYNNAIRSRIDDNISYQQFWAPIRAKLANVSKIYFSPDGIYNSININTLRGPDGKYVIDEAEVVMVSNTSDVLLSKTNSPSNRAVLIGFPDYYSKGAQTIKTEPDAFTILAKDTTQRFMSGSTITALPGTQVEVNTIEKLLKPLKVDVQKLTAQEATEERIKSLRSPRLLHIATHGFFLNQIEEVQKDSSRGFTGVAGETLKENPLLRSGLLLAGAGKTVAGERNPSGEDGIFTAYEAMNLDLSQTELVVMSACETGLGQLRSGEGVYGLQRAFRSAGAASVLMSLWKVDDQATQQLMSEFYGQWLKMGEKQKSFRDAQLKLREKFSHPYYWGAFVMVGL